MNAISNRDRYGGSDISRPKPKKRKKSHWPKGVSDTLLQDLWRKIVLSEWGGCAFHGEGCQGPVECHHIKRRGITHLKYSPSNGIPLCAYHHAEAKYDYFKQLIREKVGPAMMEWLDFKERQLLPDFLASRGQTKKEWLEETKQYLTSLAGGA